MLVPLFLSLLAAPQRATPSDPGYVLHEWGTFTTIAGSNGVVLEGLNYDDHELPDFVRRRARCPEGFDGVRCKMETPVLYFYSDREREVSVRVGFQPGILTQWYPEVHALSPPAGADAPVLRGGMLDWGRIRVLAPGRGLERLPSVGRAVHWEHARDVDANALMAHVPGEEFERFLFYRGLAPGLRCQRDPGLRGLGRAAWRRALTRAPWIVYTLPARRGRTGLDRYRADPGCAPGVRGPRQSTRNGSNLPTTLLSLPNH